MKLVGFIKEYNDVEGASCLDDLLDSNRCIEVDVEKILQYISQGVLLSCWMGYFIDVRTKELIAPDSYFTDGTWVWPAYFPYYLRSHPFMPIDKEFIEDLKSKNYHFALADEFKGHENEYEMELDKMLSSKST